MFSFKSRTTRKKTGTSSSLVNFEKLKTQIESNKHATEFLKKLRNTEKMKTRKNMATKIQQWHRSITREQPEQKADDVCAICIDTMNLTDKSTIKILVPCGHMFHRECFNKLVKRNNRFLCPLCKSPDADTMIHYTYTNAEEKYKKPRQEELDEYWKYFSKFYKEWIHLINKKKKDMINEEKLYKRKKLDFEEHPELKESDSFIQDLNKHIELLNSYREEYSWYVNDYINIYENFVYNNGITNPIIITFDNVPPFQIDLIKNNPPSFEDSLSAGGASLPFSL